MPVPLPTFELIGEYQISGLTDIPINVTFPTLRLTFIGSFSPVNWLPVGRIYQLGLLPGQLPQIMASSSLFLQQPNIVTWESISIPYALKFEPSQAIGNTPLTLRVEGSTTAIAGNVQTGTGSSMLTSLVRDIVLGSLSADSGIQLNYDDATSSLLIGVNFGDTANTVCSGSDLRLSDARNPLPGSVHNSSVSPLAGIDWSKISKVGATASDVNAAPIVHLHDTGDINGLAGFVESLLPTTGSGINTVFIDGSTPYTPSNNTRVIATISADYAIPLPVNPSPGHYFSVIGTNVSASRIIRIGTSNFTFQGASNSIYIDSANTEIGFIYVDSAIGWIATNQITKPLEVDPHWNSVVLLMPFEGANNGTIFTDARANRAITRSGNVVTSTAQSKWGKGSAYFDGSGGFLSVAGSTDFNLPGDFTIEAWLYVIAYGNFGTCFLSRAKNANGNGDYGAYFNSLVGAFWDGVSGTAISASIPGGMQLLGLWRHWAYTREGDIFKVFIDGQLIGSNTYSAPLLTSDAPLTIGRFADDNLLMNGYMNDLRVTNGVARYSTSFNPPTAPFLRR